MRWDSIKNIILNLEDLIYSFFKENNGLITFILGIIVTSVTTSLNNPYYEWLIGVALVFSIIILIYLFYYAKKRYVAITYKADYYVYYLNSHKRYLFKTPSLMLDTCFTAKLSIEVELGKFIQNKLKNDKTNYYTLVIEKDKSIEVNIDPEDIDEKEDQEYSNRNEQYYYFVQEYTGQNTLKFNINFKGFNKLNINKNCKIYLESGDIHNNSTSNFRNEFFNEEFFVTDLNSILK